jgi:H+/Cl- antiporter ClcA
MDRVRDLIHKARPLLSLPHWRGRLVLWAAAAGVGCAAVGFARLADAAQATFRLALSRSALWPWLLTPLGLALIAWLTRRYFRGAEGSGIPQTIFALRTEDEAKGDALLSLRVLAGRISLAAAALLCGASIGREGPTVQIGAAITHAIGRFIPHGDMRALRRMLIMAGGAAGVAAAFNTPLAGVVFAIEELSRSFEERASGTVLTAVVLAGVTAIALVGNYAYFGQPHLQSGIPVLSFTVLFVALAGGLGGGLFSRLTLACVRGLPGPIGRIQRDHPVWFALACGIALAAIGWASSGRTYGTGYVEARLILEQNAHLPWTYAPARAASTLLSYLSGVPAGLLAPSLSVGAGLGQMCGDLLGESALAYPAVLGMCAYLAGVTQAPMTTFVIVMEMTSGQQIVLPLMLTATIATGASKLLSPPLYRALADRYGT